jgi:hypothetical protein
VKGCSVFILQGRVLLLGGEGNCYVMEVVLRNNVLAIERLTDVKFEQFMGLMDCLVVPVDQQRVAVMAGRRGLPLVPNTSLWVLTLAGKDKIGKL